jgi:hypothetical protein
MTRFNQTDCSLVDGCGDGGELYSRHYDILCAPSPVVMAPQLDLAVCDPHHVRSPSSALSLVFGTAEICDVHDKSPAVRQLQLSQGKDCTCIVRAMLGRIAP